MNRFARARLMPRQLIYAIGFVVNAKAIHNRGLSLVHPHDIYVNSFSAQLKRYLVERRDSSDIPKVGLSKIDGQSVQSFLKIERT